MAPEDFTLENGPKYEEFSDIQIEQTISAGEFDDAFQEHVCQKRSKKLVEELIASKYELPLSCYEPVMAIAYKEKYSELAKKLFDKAIKDHRNPGTDFDLGRIFFGYAPEEAVLHMLDRYVKGNDDMLVYNQEIVYNRGGNLRAKLLEKFSERVILDAKKTYQDMLDLMDIK